jgi:DNA polymerase-3 subunit epsilon
MNPIKHFITLERPMIWLDVETHAKLPPEQGRIVEIAAIMIYPDDRPDKEWQSFINPGVPIHADTTEKHHITDAMVADAPKFAQFAPSIGRTFVDVDFGGYNVKFDLKTIAAEMDRAGVAWSYSSARIIDPLRLWQVKMPLTLTDAVGEFCNRSTTEAHRALGDTQDALDVFVGQLERFKDLPRDLKLLHDLAWPTDPNKIDDEGKFAWQGNEPCVMFGKHKGTPMRRVPAAYFGWMVDKGDFPADTKRIASEAAEGRFPTR